MMENLYIKPIYNLKLCNEDLKINNIFFKNRESMINYIKEFVTHEHLKIRLVKWMEQYESVSAFAILKGMQEEDEIELLINDALSLVALSYSVFEKRSKNRSLPSLEKTSTRMNDILKWDAVEERIERKSKRIGALDDMRLDERWRKFCKSHFWFKLINIINKEEKINSNWRKRLYAASVLAGKSQLTNDYSFAFLYNIIILEMLLTNGNDKKSDAIAERLDMIIGWHFDQSNINFQKTIKKLYNKRCCFVHDGNNVISNIDLIETDTIVYNLLNNLIRNIDRISGIDDIKNLSEKYKAFKLLRPNIKEIDILPDFTFTTNYYTEEQIKRM